VSRASAWTALAAACVLAFVALATPAQADRPGVAKAATTAPAAGPRAMLWKMSDKDNSVYLLGSFHLLKPGDYPLPAPIGAAFTDAERVVFELAPADMRAPDVGAKMMAAGTLPPGADLKQLLGPKDWARLEVYTAKRGQSAAAMARFEPWFVSLLIGMTEMRASGFDPQHGVDQYLMKRSDEDRKGTGGLESVETQIAALDGMTAEEQRQSLAEALDQAEGSDDRVAQLHALWLAGDADGIERLLLDDFRASYPRLYRRVNVDRNEAWLPKVKAMLDAPGKDDVLVVVGTMHLLGPDGLVERLRKDGYRVERM
jgi:uncharacterized protein YbaP (TraB family)